MIQGWRGRNNPAGVICKTRKGLKRRWKVTATKKGRLLPEVNNRYAEKESFQWKPFLSLWAVIPAINARYQEKEKAEL